MDDSGSAVSNEDGSEDVFFECSTDLHRLSSKPLLTDETSTSGTNQYYEQSSGDHTLPYLRWYAACSAHMIEHRVYQV